MLVHFANPHGVLYLGNLTIHGAATGRAPTDVSLELYKQNIGIAFVDATYRAYDLERIFKKPFDPVAFKITELKYWPQRKLAHLASQMGVFHFRASSATRLASAIICGLKYGERRCTGCSARFVVSRPKQVQCCNHGSKS
jgi:hypothetical protein